MAAAPRAVNYNGAKKALPSPEDEHARRGQLLPPV
jgi:hypothetical protein